MPLKSKTRTDHYIDYSDQSNLVTFPLHTFGIYPRCSLPLRVGSTLLTLFVDDVIPHTSCYWWLGEHHSRSIDRLIRYQFGTTSCVPLGPAPNNNNTTRGVGLPFFFSPTKYTSLRYLRCHWHHVQYNLSDHSYLTTLMVWDTSR